MPICCAAAGKSRMKSGDPWGVGRGGQADCCDS
jgi:hypothetical protein